jgi:uncharacterized protein YndB with AHSA1/START domain
MTTPQSVVIEADAQLPLIRIARDFCSTPTQLQRAHTDPELFAKWVGPRGLSIRILEWEARNGGAWRYVATRGEDDFYFRGCFHTVSDTIIVQTFCFESMPDHIALETLRFEDLGSGRSRLRAQSLVDNFASRDAWLATDMETGVREGYAKLDELLRQLSGKLTAGEAPVHNG